MWNLYVEFVMTHPVAAVIIGTTAINSIFSIVLKVCNTVVELAKIIRDITGDINGIVDRAEKTKTKEPIGFKCVKEES